MSLITRTYTFTDGTTAYGSQVESEIANIVAVINSLDAATTTWDIVKAVNGSATPLIADNSSGSNNVFEARVNGVAKTYVTGTGVLQAVNTIAMNATKITGLANGSAATDAAAYGQLKVVQYTQNTNTTNQSVVSSTFTAVSLTHSITPTLASNKVRITVMGHMTTAASSSDYCYATILRGSTNLANSAGFTCAKSSAATIMTVPVFMTYIDSPATTSSTTYSVALRDDVAGTVQWDTQSSTSVMILEELA